MSVVCNLLMFLWLTFNGVYSQCMSRWNIAAPSRLCILFCSVHHFQALDYSNWLENSSQKPKPWPSGHMTSSNNHALLRASWATQMWSFVMISNCPPLCSIAMSFSYDAQLAMWSKKWQPQQLMSKLSSHDSPWYLDEMYHLCRLARGRSHALVSLQETTVQQQQYLTWTLLLITLPPRTVQCLQALSALSSSPLVMVQQRSVPQA